MTRDQWREGYHVQAPKLTREKLVEVQKENIGRLTEGNQYIAGDYNSETRTYDIKVIKQNGDENHFPLGQGICRHCGSNTEPENGNGALGNSSVVICATCHAWHPIP